MADMDKHDERLTGLPLIFAWLGMYVGAGALALAIYTIGGWLT